MKIFRVRYLYFFGWAMYLKYIDNQRKETSQVFSFNSPAMHMSNS